MVLKNINYRQNRSVAMTDMVKRLYLDKIVVPLDGSEKAEKTLPYALMFSAWFDSEVVLTHVIYSVKELRAARQFRTLYPDVHHDRGIDLSSAYLGEIADLLRQHNARVHWGVSSGAVDSMVLERIAINDAGMVIMEYPATKSLRHFFYPSVVDSIWNKTPVPILIVNEEWPRVQPDSVIQEPKTLILAAHNKKSLNVSLPYLKLLFEATNAKIKIVYPLKRGFLSGLSKRPPIERAELDIATRELERMEADVSVFFTLNAVQTIRSLVKVNPHSWTITSSKFGGFLGHAWRTSFAIKLHTNLVSPVLVIPTPAVATKRRARFNSSFG